MNAASIYQSRVTTAEEAIKQVKSGNRIFLTGNVSVPKCFYRLLSIMLPM